MLASMIFDPPGGIIFDSIINDPQHYMDNQIDVQCFSKMNMDTIKNIAQQTLRNSVLQMDNSTYSTWESNQIPPTSTYKSGGTGIATFGSHAGQIKEVGNDPLVGL